MVSLAAVVVLALALALNVLAAYAVPRNFAVPLLAVVVRVRAPGPWSSMRCRAFSRCRSMPGLFLPVPLLARRSGTAGPPPAFLGAIWFLFCSLSAPRFLPGPIKASF